MSKRERTPPSNNGQRNVRRIDLNNCISDEPNVSVPVSQVEVTYEVFRPVILVGGIEDHDLIISRKRPECPNLKRIEELETKCGVYEEQLNNRDFLRLFSEAYQLYGNKVILPYLKNNSADATIRGFTFWSDCTRQLTRWRMHEPERYAKLQDGIDTIVEKHHIQRDVWGDIVFLNKMRNNDVHPPPLPIDKYCEKLRERVTEFKHDTLTSARATNAMNQLIGALRATSNANNGYSTDAALAGEY